MLRASVLFFLLGLFSLIFGINRLAGISFEQGRSALFVFLSLAILSFIASLVPGRPESGGQDAAK